ncbi:MAG: dihydroorotate dehydrogenase [Planctomycetes bacterium]|nr:dihydroorotate dehydrogenase [Planctomycetota bacterium]
MPTLNVKLRRLELANPILVASGTFGYAREMTAFVPFDRLGGIVPKTITLNERKGNPPPRTVETSSGLLNSIGLDNDGIDVFVSKHVPYLTSLGTKIVANIAGHSSDEFMRMAERLDTCPGLAAIELNISCPNVSGGVDFGVDPEKTAGVVRGVREVCRLPILAKLTPNVTDIRVIAQAAAEAGADAVTIANTFQGMAIDWRRRKPILGNNIGGLSGPAIKPIVLRMVWQVAQKVQIPVVAVGGISSVDDVLEFLVAGATAVQIGTANFYNPTLAGKIVDELDAALAGAGCTSVQDIIGTLKANG